MRGLANLQLRVSTTASPEICTPTSMLRAHWAGMAAVKENASQDQRRNHRSIRTNFRPSTEGIRTADPEVLNNDSNKTLKLTFVDSRKH